DIGERTAPSARDVGGARQWPGGGESHTRPVGASGGGSRDRDLTIPSLREHAPIPLARGGDLRQSPPRAAHPPAVRGAPGSLPPRPGSSQLLDAGRRGASSHL